jgi:hypothetical protein
VRFGVAVLPKESVSRSSRTSLFPRLIFASTPGGAGIPVCRERQRCLTTDGFGRSRICESEERLFISFFEMIVTRNNDLKKIARNLLATISAL